MQLRTIPISATAALALITAPIAASAAPIEGARASTPVEGERLDGNFAPAWIVAAILVGVLGYLVLSDDDDDDAFPVSP